VRLTCAEGFIPYLVAELEQMRVAHPQLSVELLPSTAALDLLRREADVALRMFRPTQAALVARRVGILGWVALRERGLRGAKRSPCKAWAISRAHDLIRIRRRAQSQLRAALARRARRERSGGDAL